MLTDEMRPPLLGLLLSIADEKLLLGHRNGDWTGLGPFLEEDIAFSNIAQDEIAHAQELYKLAAGLSGPSAEVVAETNRLAYARPAGERLHANLVELHDEYDWAFAIARQFCYDHYDRLRLTRLRQSTWKPLADLAGKMLQEISFHITHFDGWIAKLAQGTAESKDRLQGALNTLWPHALGLFEPIAEQDKLVALGLYAGDDSVVQDEWLAKMRELLGSVGLAVPSATRSEGGRRGRHTPALDELLADLAEVYQYEPDAKW